EDVYRALQKRAAPLEDTPSSVIRRLIEEIETQPEKPGESQYEEQIIDKRRTVKSAGRTPQRAFRRPILESLKELGGRAPVDDVLTLVYQRVKHQLSSVDHTTISTGEKRWRVYARWERKNMELEGLLRGPRGMWEITEKGRACLESNDTQS